MVGRLEPNNFPDSLIDANRYLTNSNKIGELFYKGSFDSSIFDRCIAIVGSRRSTSYGEKVCRQVAYEIAECGITVVSGFMYGIDSFAHESAIDAGGKTIAVLGYGIKREPLNYQKYLFNRILNNGGLILSEYGNNEPAQKWTFPKRNRIVAGLSNTTLVIEAAESSGSLITANYALKMKRKVFAAPGSFFSKNSAGTANIIRGRGEILTSSRDILRIFDQNRFPGSYYKQGCLGDNTNHKLIKKELKSSSKEQKISENIKNLLKIDSLTINELAAELDIEFSKLSKNLVLMQLYGEICEVDGRFYAR